MLHSNDHDKQVIVLRVLQGVLQERSSDIFTQFESAVNKSRQALCLRSLTCRWKRLGRATLLLINGGKGTLFKKKPKKGFRGLSKIMRREVVWHRQPKIREPPAKREPGRRGID